MTIPVKTQTARQYLDIYAIELETISELTRKAQARGLKNWLSDVNHKVNFRSIQVEAFIDRKVSNQFLIILNAKIFILNRKKVARRTFYLFKCCWVKFCEKTARKP